MLEDFQGRPVKVQPQRCVSRHVEGRDADVGGRQACRHTIVLDHTRQPDAVLDAGGRLAHPAEFRAIANHHRRNVSAGRTPEGPDRVDEMDGAVPTTERPGKDRERFASSPHERGRTERARPKPLRIGAPFDLEDPLASYLVGTIDALGVTIRAATRHCHSRQRRIGSTSSARSNTRLGEPS